jgi:long-subunit fatty acid transport protein
VTDKLSLGAAVKLYSTHRVHETVFTEYATLYEEDRDFTMPWSAGLGAAYVVGPRGRFAADLRYTAWSAFAVDGHDFGYRNTLEFHAGAEGRLTTAKKSFFLWRMPYRAGVSYVPWYSTEHGELAKMGVSVGAGYLFKNNENSRLDVALGYSRRGNSPSEGLKEEMIDFYVSIVGLEAWLGKRGRED